MCAFIPEIIPTLQGMWFSGLHDKSEMINGFRGMHFSTGQSAKKWIELNWVAADVKQMGHFIPNELAACLGGISPEDSWVKALVRLLMQVNLLLFTNSRQLSCGRPWSRDETRELQKEKNPKMMYRHCLKTCRLQMNTSWVYHLYLQVAQEDPPLLYHQVVHEEDLTLDHPWNKTNMNNLTWILIGKTCWIKW